MTHSPCWPWRGVAPGGCTEGRLAAVERTSEREPPPGPARSRRADPGLALGKGTVGFSALFPSGSKVRAKVQTKTGIDLSVPYLNSLPGKENASNLSGSHTLLISICGHVGPHPRFASRFLVLLLFNPYFPLQHDRVGSRVSSRHRAPTGTPTGVTPRTVQSAGVLVIVILNTSSSWARFPTDVIPEVEDCTDLIPSPSDQVRPGMQCALKKHLLNEKFQLETINSLGQEELVSQTNPLCIIPLLTHTHVQRQDIVSGAQTMVCKNHGHTGHTRDVQQPLSGSFTAQNKGKHLTRTFRQMSLLGLRV